MAYAILYFIYPSHTLYSASVNVMSLLLTPQSFIVPSCLKLYADSNFCSPLSALRQKSLLLPLLLLLLFPSATPSESSLPSGFMSCLAMKLTHRILINTAFRSNFLCITHFSTQLLHPFSPSFPSLSLLPF